MSEFAFVPPPAEDTSSILPPTAPPPEAEFAPVPPPPEMVPSHETVDHAERAAQVEWQLRNVTRAPEEQAQILDLAKKTSWPADVVAQDIPKARAAAGDAGLDFVQLSREAPELSSFASDPAHAPLVQGDAGVLAQLEAFFRGRRLPDEPLTTSEMEQGITEPYVRHGDSLGWKAVMLGLAEREMAAAHEEQLYGPPLGDAEGRAGELVSQGMAALGMPKRTPAERVELAQARIEAIKKQAGWDELPTLASVLTDSTKLAVSMGPELAAAGAIGGAAKALGGARAAFAAGTAFWAHSTAPSTYANMKEVKTSDGAPVFTDDQARLVAYGLAVPVGMLYAGMGEAVAGRAKPYLGWLAEKTGVSAGADYLARAAAGKALASPLVQKLAAAESMQFAKVLAEASVQYGVHSVSGAATLATATALEKVTELVARAAKGDTEVSAQEVWQTWATSFQQGLKDFVLIGAVGPVREAMRGIGRANASIEGARQLSDVANGTKTSKLAQRSPEKFAELVERFQSDKQVAIDLARFESYAQEQNLQPRELAASILDDKGAAYDTAKAEGKTELVVPLHRYSSKMVLQGHADALRLDMRLGLETDTPRQLIEAEKRREKTASERENSPAFQAEVEDIKRLMVENLVKSGMDKDKADFNGDLASKMAKTAALKFNVPVVEGAKLVGFHKFEAEGINLLTGEEKARPATGLPAEMSQPARTTEEAYEKLGYDKATIEQANERRARVKEALKDEGLDDPHAEVSVPADLSQLQNIPAWLEGREAWMRSQRDANGEPRWTEEHIQRQLAADRGGLRLLTAVGLDRAGLADALAMADAAVGMGLPQGAGLAKDGPLRSNSDDIYVYSIDFSAECVKRLGLAATSRYIAQTTGRAPSSSEVMALTALYREAGLIAPCTICYVEAKRIKINDALNTSQELAYNPDLPIPPKWAASTKDLVAEARAEVKALKLGRNAIDLAGYTDTTVQMSPEWKAQVESAPALHALYDKQAHNTKANQAKPYEEYVAQVLGLTPAEVATLNKYAGLRMQSSSDFQPEHTIDAIQVHGDAELKELRAHTYTKVPDFVLIFGDTGNKINLSIFAQMPGRIVEDGKTVRVLKGSGDSATEEVLFEASGRGALAKAEAWLDNHEPEGGFLPDNSEGMNWKDARDLTDRYKHAGPIIVATSSAMIRWAMKQPWIHQIIPYHASGLEKKFSRPLGWSDYSSTQKEKFLKEHDFVIEGERGAYTVKKDGELLGTFKTKGEAEKATDAPQIRMWELGMEKGVEGDAANLKVIEKYLALCAERGVRPVFEEFLRPDGVNIDPGYLKLKKDYARTDSSFDPVNASAIDYDHANRVLSEYLASDAGNTPPDVDMANKLLTLRKWQEAHPDKDVGTEAIRHHQARSSIMEGVTSGKLVVGSRPPKRRAEPAPVAGSLIASIGRAELRTDLGQAKLVDGKEPKGKIQRADAFAKSEAQRVAMKTSVDWEHTEVTRWFEKEMRPKGAGRVLDFGGGKEAVAKERMRAAGYDIDAYDLWATNDPAVAAEGRHVLRLERGAYDHILASNVINVQNDHPAMLGMIEEWKGALAPGGKVWLNLTKTPRKGWYGEPRQGEKEFSPHERRAQADKLELFLKRHFGKVERSGASADPTFRLSDPKPTDVAAEMAEAKKRAMFDAVRKSLTPDLLKADRRAQYAEEGNYAGHCQVATNALFHLLGGKASGWSEMMIPRKVLGSDTHYFLKNEKTGEILDPTAEQFGGEKIPYDKAQRAGSQQWGDARGKPTQRAQEVIRRVGGEPAFRAALAAAEGAVTELDQLAYHGTSKRGIQRFDSKFIGKGQGAASYGYGHYSGEAVGTAMSYFHELSDGHFKPDVEAIANLPSMQGLNRGQREAAASMVGNILNARHGDAALQGGVTAAMLDEVAGSLGQHAQRDPYKARGAALARDLAEAGMEGTLKPGGQVYKVQVPEKDQLLSWDHALDEQPPAVLERLRDASQERSVGGALIRQALRENHTGEMTYRLLSTKLWEAAWSEGEPGMSLDSRERRRDAYRRASMWLKEHGLEGLKYHDAESRQPAADAAARLRNRKESITDASVASEVGAPVTHNFVIWTDEAVRVEAELYQRDLDSRRGSIQFVVDPNGKPRNFNIRYLNGDASTFAHELAHFVSWSMHDLAARVDAPADVRGDYEKMLKYMGYDSPEHRLMDSIERAELGATEGRTAADDGRLRELNAKEERFSHAWEQYLLEGKPPSTELVGAFGRFRKWLKKLYGGVQGIEKQYREHYGQELAVSDEVRGVFNRLLAVDGAIEAMRQTDRSVDFSDLLRLTGAQRAQLAKLNEKKFEDARWLMDVAVASGDSPTDAMLRERERLTKDVTEEVQGSDSVYQAKRLIEQGVLDEAGAGEFFGLGSAADVRHAIRTAKPLDEVVGAEVNKRMAEIFGPRLSENADALRALGMEALRNPAEIDEALAKHDAIVRELGPMAEGRQLNRQEEVKAARRAVLADTVENLSRLDDGRSMEEKAFATMEEARAASDKGDKEKSDPLYRQALDYHDGALRAKLKARIAKDVVKQLDAAKEKLKSAGSEAAAIRAGKVDGTLAYQDGLLAIVQGAGVQPGQPEAGVISTLLAKMQQDGGAVAVDAEGKLQAALWDSDAVAELAAHPARWETLTAAEAFNARDAAENVSKMVANLGKVQLANRKVARAEFIAELEKTSRHLGTSPGEDRSPRAAGSAKRLGRKTLELLQTIDANLLDIEGLADRLSGGDRTSGIWQLLVGDRLRARDRESEMLGVYQAKLEKAFEGIRKLNLDEVLPGARLDFPLPDTKGQLNPASNLTRGDLLAIALNLGNDGNLQRLRDGYGWADPQRRLEKYLTREEWQAVQSVWDALGGLFKDIEKVEVADHGVRPDEVEATPFTVRLADGSTMRMEGGYYPARYDRRVKSTKLPGGASIDSVAGVLGDSNPRRPKTATTHSQQRAEKFDGLLDLSLDVLPDHVRQVIHDISHRMYVKNAANVFLDPDFQALVKARMGAPYQEVLVPWLTALAGERVNGDSMGRVMKALNWSKNRVSVAAVGFNVGVALADLANPMAPVMAGAVSAKHLAQVTAKLGTNWTELRRFALENSPELRERARHGNSQGFNVDDIARRGITGQAGRKFDHAAFWMMERTDRMTATPVWLAKFYELAPKVGEAQAIVEADAVVRKFFPAADNGSRAMWLRNNGNFLSQLSFLYGFANKVYNVNRAAIAELGDTWRDPEEGAGGKAQAVARAVATIVGTGLVFGSAGAVLSGHGPKKDDIQGPGDAATWALHEATWKHLLYGIPVVGQTLVMNRPATSPALRWLETAGRVINEKDTPAWQKALEMGGNVVADLVPGSGQARKTGRYLLGDNVAYDNWPTRASGAAFGTKGSQAVTPFNPGGQ